MRDLTPRELAEGSLLDQDLEGSPLKGKPLPGRLRNFRPAVDGYVASLGGPLAYMRRLRQIELETEQHEQRLAEAWRELAEECAGHDASFARRWRRTAERWSFTAVNELIDRHNRWYPTRRGCRWTRAAATSCSSRAVPTGCGRSTMRGRSSASRPSSRAPGPPSPRPACSDGAPDEERYDRANGKERPERETDLSAPRP